MKNILEAKIGFGTYKLVDQTKIDQSIEAAILSNYDFIDTAWYYKNEKQIGNAIKKFKKNYPNHQIIPIQTKIWPSFYEKNLESELKKSLKKLGLEKIDACLLHRPHVDNTINVKGWKQLINCQKKGLIEHIGVSNFEPDMIRILFNETGIMPEIIQDELSASYLRKDRIKFANANIKMPQAWKPLGLLEKNLNDPLLKKFAKKYECSITQLLVAYVKSFNYVPVIKSENPQRISDNIKGIKIKLKKADIDQIEAKLNQHETTISTSSDSYANLSISKKM